MPNQIEQKINQALPNSVTVKIKPIWTKILSSLYNERIKKPRKLIHISPSGVCNLSCKFCAYRHKERDKIIMPNEKFFALVDQASQMGYEQIAVTPLTGDVYTDPNFTQKLSFLEEHPGINRYHFFTNMTLATERDLKETLTDCDKLKGGDWSIHISIYGHNRESFKKITGGADRHFDQLVSNLEFLIYYLDDSSLIDIGFHTYESINPIELTKSVDGEGQNKLLENVKVLREELGVKVNDWTGPHNNWGGTVSQEDVEDIDMTVAEEKLDKNGPCSLIFRKNIILPDGTVNACACRDVEATLALGDVDDRPLEEILSPSENDTYSQLIRKQNAGEFPEICHSCDFYDSIREPQSTGGVSLKDFYEFYDPMKNEYKLKTE